MMFQYRKILGVDVLVAREDEAVQAVDARLEADAPALITFLNANVSNLTFSEQSLGVVLRRSLVLNDGIGVDIASQLLCGAKFPQNLQGTDFVPAYLRNTRHRFRIFAVGSAPGIAARAMDALKLVAPSHFYLGAHSGFFDQDQGRQLKSEILASGADLVLVGMGTPTQELWADQEINAACGLSAICVGGLFDFLSEAKPRAPRWVQRVYCEWVFRLLVEPARLWRRYLIGNSVFMARLLHAVVRSRLMSEGRNAIP